MKSRSQSFVLVMEIRRSVRVALTLAGIACLIRPTSAVQWAFLGVGLLLRTPREQCLTLINNVFVIGYVESSHQLS